MSLGGYARTTWHTVYVPPGEMSDPGHMQLMMHEFTHLWQYQHGYSIAQTIACALFCSYDYGRDDGLRAAAKAGKRFVDFNTEQQGDICRDYWLRKTAGGDTSAFDPFIAQLANPWPAPHPPGPWGSYAGGDLPGDSGSGI